MTTLASGSSSIQGTTSVSSLFQHKFVVPAYQRPFDWGNREVAALLKDLYDHAASAPEDLEDIPDYLLNSILTLDTGSELHLIDGQQRVTALTLLFAAARDIGREYKLLSESYLHTLEALVAVRDGDNVQPRLCDQYPNGPAQAFLEQLAKGTPGRVDRANAAHPLHRGYEQIIKWLKETFVTSDPAGPVVLTRFLDVVRKKAKFAEIRVAQSSVCWQSFERANDRGKPLCIADRVKSDLFNKAKSESERREVADGWRKVLEELRACSVPADVFLHHLALADFADNKATKSAVRDLFRKLLEDGTYSASELALHLASASQAYIRILKYRIPTTGNHCVPLGDLGQVPRFRRVVQMRPALLAARKFTEQTFSGIAAELERFAVVVVLTEQRGQSYEKDLFDLAKFLRTNGETATIVSEFRTRVDALLSRFETDLVKFLGSATKDSLDHDAVKYLLGRAETFLRTLSNTGAPRLPVATLAGGVNHVEHILPQSLSEKAVAEFGSSADARRLVQALGNLTIWEGSQNSGMRDAPFSAKCTEYASSEHKITKSLAGAQGSVGGNKEVAKRLSAASVWNVQSLERRHQEIGSLIGEMLLGHPVKVSCSVMDESSMLVEPPAFPHLPHLPVVLAGVANGLRTATEIVGMLEGVNTAGVINQALSALRYLDLVESQNGIWNLTELGQVVCSESEDSWPIEVAGLIVSNPTIRRCAEIADPTSSNKVKRAANAFDWAQSVLNEDFPSGDNVSI